MPETHGLQQPDVRGVLRRGAGALLPPPAPRPERAAARRELRLLRRVGLAVLLAARDVDHRRLVGRAAPRSGPAPEVPPPRAVAVVRLQPRVPRAVQVLRLL